MKNAQFCARIASRSIAALLAVLVTGCGSSGGSGSSPSAPSTPSFGTNASLTLVIPPATAQSVGRKPNYISPNTASIQIVIDNVNGSTNVPPGIPVTQTVKLTTGTGGNCAAPTAAGSTCTAQFVSPAGVIVFTFTIFDAAGHALATAKTQLSIIKGQSNSNLQVLLGGIVASVKILVPTITSGVPAKGNLIVSAYDASGALIDASAPFATPIVLTDTDPTTATTLAVRNQLNVKSAQVNIASDVVTFSYTGSGSVPPFSINATVGGTAVGTSGTILPSTQAISFSNTYVDTNLPKAPSYGQPTIFFASVGTPGAPVTQTTTASESGYTGSFTAAINAPSCVNVSNNLPVASISASPNTTFTVTALNPGFCEVLVQDTISHQSIFWVSVTTGIITINDRTRQVVR